MKRIIKSSLLFLVASLLLTACDSVQDFLGISPDYSYRKAPPPPSDAIYYQNRAGEATSTKSTAPASTPRIRKSKGVTTKTSSVPVVPPTVPSIVPTIPTTTTPAPATAAPTTAPVAPIVAPSVIAPPIVSQ